jgi:hypothetical protein
LLGIYIACFPLLLPIVAPISDYFLFHSFTSSDLPSSTMNVTILIGAVEKFHLHSFLFYRTAYSDNVLEICPYRIQHFLPLSDHYLSRVFVEHSTCCWYLSSFFLSLPFDYSRGSLLWVPSRTLS